MERKATEQVMGATQSYTGSLEDPFPIPPNLNNDLDRLSFVAARILSTPDIYDVKNLEKPGVCGEYAVFLKKNIENALLTYKSVDAMSPFTAQIGSESGGRESLEVVYQKPSASFGTGKEKEQMRKEICDQMTKALLRTIAIVVSLLASIQIGGQNRKAAISTVPRMVGGGIPEVRTWLVNNRVVKPTTNPNVFEFVSQGSNYSRFFLQLYKPYGNATYGTITAKRTTSEDPFPDGGLHIHFLDPSPVSPTISVLPVRVLDSTGQTWFAGILVTDFVKSFHLSTPQNYFTDILEALFRKTQGWNVTLHETRGATLQANEVWQQVKRSGTPQPIVTALGSWFQTNIPGYVTAIAPVAHVVPGYGAPGYGVPGYGAPGYGAPGYGAPGYGAPGYGAPGYVAPGYGAAIRPSIPGYAAAPGIYRPMTETFYHIPKPAQTIIIESFKAWREYLPEQSSPAVVRSLTLRGSLTPKRTIITNICSDPYWTGKNGVKNIYPWATFQFLSIKDWNSLNDRTRPIQFFPEWENFVNEMSNPSLPVHFASRPTDMVLDQLSFVGKEKFCDKKEVGFEEVQSGLEQIQKVYADHVKEVWKILNDLIYVVSDPAKKVEVVRLHPSVVSTQSLEYVNKKAEAARSILSQFYVTIEKLYQGIARSLKPVV